jgi:hypothetical protein
MSVDKKINRKHALNLTFLGAPSIRGKVSDSFGEMFELAGTHRYNPSWGYQNGREEKCEHRTFQSAGLAFFVTTGHQWPALP